MMRSLVVLIILMTASILTFASGAKEATAPSAVQTVSVWGWWDMRMELFNTAGKAFSARNPNVRIEVTTIPAETIWKKAVPAFAAGNGPSLILGDAAKFYDFQSRGLLDPYSGDSFPSSWVEANFPNVQWSQGLAKDGRYYVFPGGYCADILIYNKRMFKEAGLDPDKPPTTWDELAAAAQKLTKRDAGGNLIQAGYEPGQEYFLLTYVYQAGGDIVKQNSDGSVTATMTAPEVKKAFQFLVDMYTRSRVTSYDLPNIEVSLGEEKVAMSIASSWIAGDVQTNHPDAFANLGFAMAPTPTGKAAPYTGRKDPVILLMANAKRPDAEKAAAQSFLKFIYKDNDSFLKDYARLLGIAPSKKSLFSDPDIMGFPAMGVMVKSLDSQKGPLAVTDDLTAVFKNALERVILRGTGVDESLATANNELAALIKDQPALYSHLH
jgi:multiple sugar transport system substrate-binding protein